ncbi:MAG: dUTP diphosphatase [Myxococcaceae bacterium]
MNPPIQLRVRRVRPSAIALPFPQYQTQLAAGMDLLADIDQEIPLAPMGRAAIPTGLAFELPAGYEGQVRPRSGLALRQGLTVLNSPGTVDADYRGEVQVILVNLSDVPVTIKRGDRIAQFIISPVTRATLIEVQDLSATARGEGGFGSTGR